MKPWYLFFILFCACTFSSCNKHIQSSEQPNGKVLPGLWELRAESGGQVPYDPNNYKPGNGSLWKFTQTEFARIYKDSVYRSGTYAIRLGAGTDLNTGRKIDQFVFNNEPAESFELRNDTLRFYYGFIPADGDIEMYVKIAEDH
ncbi:MAG TPA: hypothetical protein VK588_07585 [Chitinophagaceae bacterium]|nr:hypothetical protein [Chitinophagaceae bacterium]